MITTAQIRDVAFASDRATVAVSVADFERLTTELNARVDHVHAVRFMTILTERGAVTILRDPGKAVGEISCPASARPLSKLIIPDPGYYGVDPTEEMARRAHAKAGEGQPGVFGIDERRPGWVLGPAMLPTHLGLNLRHNPHKLEYMTIARWLENWLFSATGGDADEPNPLDPADRAAILERDEVWEISWCPRTPVGSCCVVAATLERALQLANAGDR